MLFEYSNDFGNCGSLLTNRDVETVHTLTFLIQYCIDGNRALTNLTVSDDQFPLPPADGDH